MVAVPFFSSVAVYDVVAVSVTTVVVVVVEDASVFSVMVSVKE